MSKTTPYGFKWEENGIRMVVQRTFADSQHMCLTIYTDKGAQDIYVTPSGMMRIAPAKKPGKKGPAGERIDPDYLKSIMDQ